MKHRNITLEDKYRLQEGRVFITGIQALVRLPLDQARLDHRAGLTTAGFISGYRGSPLGGYDQQLHRAQKFLEGHNIVFKEGLNEDLGATAVWGSQMTGSFPGARYDGVFGLWYGKAPGVDRSGDAFKHANFAGTSRHGGVLAVAGDDPLCKSSTLPSQSEFAFADAEIPVLHPSSIQEVLDYGLYGWAMSRFSGCWTGLIALADTMDSGAVCHIDLDRLDFHAPDFEFPPDGVSLRPKDAPLAKEERMRRYKIPAAQAFVRSHGLDKIILQSAKPRLGIVTTGQAARDIFEALDAMGITEEEAADLGLSVYKLAMPWPLEEEGLRRFARGLETVFVVEHKRPLIEPQVKAALYDLPEAERPRLLGKKGPDGRPWLPETLSIPLVDLASALLELLPDGPHQERAEGYLAREVESARIAEAEHSKDARAPFFCSGCPHNTSTKLPEGSRALAGIGCHYMTFLNDPKTDMASHMGAEGVAWIGHAPFTDENHVFVNLGDGTYSHSGSLAIRASLAAGVNITYKILLNDAVAMTGGQSPEMKAISPHQVLEQLKAEGVKTLALVTDHPEHYHGENKPSGVPLHDRSDLETVQRAFRETPGVSVIVYEQVCATEKRRRRKRGLMAKAPARAFINEAVCEGCGDCSLASQCLSVEPLETELGRKRIINQASCNQDMSCVEGFCPSFVSVEGAEPRKAPQKTLHFDSASVPTPPPAASSEEVYNLVFSGVGGTGVTTVAAILAMAAHIDGRAASVLDMTGLAQKGGAVLSHVRFAKTPDAIRSGRVPPASADVLMACDLIVAAGEDCLRMTHKERTTGFFNRDVTPTKDFVTERDKTFEAPLYARAIREGVETAHDFHASGLAQALFGDTIYANMLLLGFAWQHGAVPVSSRALYRAIELNGVSIKQNRMAFEAGRLAAHDFEALKELLPKSEPENQPQSLEALTQHREALLTAYQSKAYAQRYRALVKKVQAREQELDLGDNLTRAVAFYAAKLMAYKDEYEVARLYTDGAFQEKLKGAFSGPYHLKLHLAPPLFSKRDPVTGHLKKRAYGPWVFKLFRILKVFKRLRGTPFDIFGYTEERKMERRLIQDYEVKTDRLLAGLKAENHSLAVRLASTPDGIRGYGHVKEASFKTTATYEKTLWKKWETLEN